MNAASVKNTVFRRRRRHCEKYNLELKRDQPDLIQGVDSYPVTPITPPAAFLVPGCSKISFKGEPVYRRGNEIMRHFADGSRPNGINQINWDLPASEFQR